MKHLYNSQPGPERPNARRYTPPVESCDNCTKDCKKPTDVKKTSRWCVDHLHKDRSNHLRSLYSYLPRVESQE